MSHWNAHPHVRTGSQLTPGERAADSLKKWFGTWTALFGVGAAIAVWILLQKTSIRWDIYPFILLNLCLSCLAAVQGIILQISANRGDRISSEVATGTYNNGTRLLAMNEQQLDILGKQSAILAELRGLRAGLGQPEHGSEGA
jgi:uncharacterized membrane protein